MVTRRVDQGRAASACRGVSIKGGSDWIRSDWTCRSEMGWIVLNGLGLSIGVVFVSSWADTIGHVTLDRSPLEVAS